MKAVHIGQAHSVDDIRIVRKECATLVDAGIDTVYITQQKDRPYHGEKICGVSVYTYSPYIMNKMIPLLSTRIGRYRALRLALRLGGDVYHVHELHSWLVARALKRKGKKVIFDQHEDSPGQVYQIYFDRYRNMFIAAIFRKIEILMEKYTVKNCDLVIATSEMIARNLHNYNLNDNIIVLHNYADRNATQCDITDYLSRGRNICYAGGLFERRGLKYVMDAMDNVDGIFEYAGQYDSKMQPVYEKSAGWRRCRYLGNLSRDEVNRLYERCRVGIINNLDLPYHRNSNPNKLFEYMAAGLPIVCTSIPAWAQIIKDVGCGIVVDATDVTEIAAAINYLLDNPNEAQQMGLKGYQAFMDVYNWDVEKQKLIDGYRNLKLR